MILTRVVQSMHYLVNIVFGEEPNSAVDVNLDKIIGVLTPISSVEVPDVMDINVTIYLFTLEKRKEPQIFNCHPNDKEIEKSLFSSKRKTKFLIHGWQANFNNSLWMMEMVNRLLDTSDSNIFAIDWSQEAGRSDYVESAVATQVVGKAIANFIKKLVDLKGLSVKDVHCIGHSLGAHTCGFFGKNFDNPKFKRITALEPAAPVFISNTDDLRLSKTDADLVVVIHANSGVMTTQGKLPITVTGFLGFPHAIGHFDFWPNGGSKQPGCGVKENAKNITMNPKAIGEFFACNHGRATTLPITRPINNCQFIAYQCQKYKKFQDGECADCGPDESKCKPLEFEPEFWDDFNTINENSNESTKYYLKTSSSPPFCLFHYQILVQISPDSKKRSWGRISVTISNKKEFLFPQNSIMSSLLGSVIWEAKNPNILGFRSGQNYSQLYYDSKELPLSPNITVKWSSNAFSKVKIERISFNYMTSMNKKDRIKKSQHFCPNDSEIHLSNGNSVSFNKCSP